MEIRNVRHSVSSIHTSFADLSAAQEKATFGMRSIGVPDMRL